MPDAVGTNVFEEQIAEGDVCDASADSGLDGEAHLAFVHVVRTRRGQRNDVERDPGVVTDTMILPEFGTTGLLAPGGEQSFVMNTVGETEIHCTIHPQMVGTLIVRER